MGAFEDFVNVELPRRVHTDAEPTAGNFPRFQGFATHGRGVEERTPAQVQSDIDAAATLHTHEQFAHKSHYHDALEILYGTLDGDRLPAMSQTKKGGVPATGSPTSTKYLRDDGTWQTPPGGGGDPDTDSMILAGRNYRASLPAVPEGLAGGDLSGVYPNPSVLPDVSHLILAGQVFGS